MLTSELLELLFRATLLMVAGLMAARLAERRSATISHRVLAATGFCVVLLPIMSHWGPRWEWTRPTWFISSEPVLSAQHSTNAAILSTIVDGQPGTLPGSVVPRTTNAAWNWASVLILLWICGSIVMIARLGSALLRLRSTLMNSREAPETIIANVKSMASDLSVREQVHIRLASTEAMPMVCWFGGWGLVLPSNFEAWDEELKQATISHELGHISRRDVWVDYGIQCLGCLLWWHPLIWMMVRAVTRLRELACDEWVLQSTRVSARRYAHSLLEVVRICQVEERQLATPMATQGELESRLRSISSPNRSKKVGAIWLALCVMGIAGLTVSIALVSLVNDKSQKPYQTNAGVFGDDQPPSDLGGSTITGLVTQDGNPISGIKVKLLKTPEGKPNQLHAIVTTDDQGRYTIPGMHPGERYRLEIQPEGNWMVRNWQYQSPYVNAVTGGEGETIELPDAEMVSNTQVLTGLVIDPQGKPVSGISVAANLASGGMLSQASSWPPPWTETDSQGRFSLTKLPEEIIELMAYKRNPVGGRILHPCKLKVELNQKEIRIVFDPKLGSGIEDLDAR